MLQWEQNSDAFYIKEVKDFTLGMSSIEWCDSISSDQMKLRVVKMITKNTGQRGYSNLKKIIKKTYKNY